MNKFMIGGVTFQNEVESASISTSHAMVGESLAADTLTVVLVLDNGIDIETQFEEGSEVLYYNDTDLVGKFFLQSVKRVAANKYRVSAVSIIGMLLNSRHYGGIYVGVASESLFADILSGVTYVLDPDVASATVTGYLPIATRRDNLQQLLMAVGATIKIDDEGTLYITSMSSVSSGVFDASRCYIGGSVTTDKSVVGVQVTEHNYFEAGNEVVLFSDGVDGSEFIEFSQPYHGLKIEGGSIVESGANFARISAKGTVVLTGKPYTHVTRVVTAGSTEASPTDTIKTVTNCYLANPQIAQSLADRLFSFLQCNKTIQQDVLFGTERAGDVVSMINPYTMEQETGTIQEMDVTVSGVNKAAVKMLVGFSPAGVISGFKNYAMLTGSGSWSVPSGVEKIRIILVGGGTGGGGGNRGSAGGNSTDEHPIEVGDGGAGGSAGKAGAGGRIFEISLDVSSGQAFSYACGSGGAGGAGQTANAKAADGSAGVPTTFGGYSSDYGRLYPYGYYEAKTGITFSAAGAEGYAGGRGGKGNDTEWDDNYEEKLGGENGESVAGYAGGSGRHYHYTGSYDRRNTTEYYGGGGGGAAYGTKGGDAPGGSEYNASSAGGVGATGVAGLSGTNPGQGGGAGHGGGGGGGAGTVYHWNPTFDDIYYISASGGAPGNGSAGGKGAAGAIIIYY